MTKERYGTLASLHHGYVMVLLQGEVSMEQRVYFAQFDNNGQKRLWEQVKGTKVSQEYVGQAVDFDDARVEFYFS